jgi:hypothetical protein
MYYISKYDQQFVILQELQQIMYIKTIL